MSKKEAATMLGVVIGTKCTSFTSQGRVIFDSLKIVTWSELSKTWSDVMNVVEKLTTYTCQN